MAEGPPERPGRTPLPHIVVPWAASDQAYKGRAGGQSKLLRTIGNRQEHTARLTGELESAHTEAQAKVAEVAEVSPDIAADGFALSVESWSDEPGYKLALQSLDSSGAKLLSVVPETESSPERAVVWLPFAAVGKFFTKIEQFATEDTARGHPKNQALVANIGELRLAVLHDLWQEPEEFPEPDEVRWWEVWLSRLRPARPSRNTAMDDSSFRGPGAVARAVAAERGWPMVPELLTFPENVVALIRASASELGVLLSTSAVPSELHRARATSEIFSLDGLDQDEWVANLEGRLKPAEPDAAAVCVLDTGLMSGHPLLRSSVDRALSALDGYGPGDQAGHGTAMAGLALFRDLDGDLLGSGVVSLSHRIESVRVMRSGHDTTNDPEMYGTITADAAARVELEQTRRRVFSMAITADTSDGSDGRPQSYSAAVDALAFGTDIARSDDGGIELLGLPDPRAARLFVLSTGNIRDRVRRQPPGDIRCQPGENPAQAWNALSVGAYTEKITPPSAPTVRRLAHGRTRGRAIAVQPHVHDLRPWLADQARHRHGGREPTRRSERHAVRPARRRVLADDAQPGTRTAHHGQRDERSHRTGGAARRESRWSSTRVYGRRRCAACSCTRRNGLPRCRRTSTPQGSPKPRTHAVAATLRLGGAHRGAGAQQRGQLGDAHPPGRVPAVRAWQERRNHDARAPAP